MKSDAGGLELHRGSVAHAGKLVEMAERPMSPGPHGIANRARIARTTWLNQAKSAWALGLIWARLDSNQGPTDYESAALTS